MEQLKELPQRHQQILAFIPNGSDTMLKRAEKVRNADIETAQAYKEKYKLTPANIPAQTTLQFNYERSVTPLN